MEEGDLTIQMYLGNIPLIHTWDDGVNWNSGGFDFKQLSFFIELCSSIENCRIIETGAGNSTIAFLLAKPKELISIAPDEKLFNRITEYCSMNSISVENLKIAKARSEWELPLLAMDGKQFEIGLIDGAHGWPNTFVDLNYIYFMLTKGGFLIIDDVQLHSIKEIAKFIIKQSTHFVLEKDLGKTLIFRKLTDDFDLGDWNQQIYILEKSNAYELQENPNSLDEM